MDERDILQDVKSAEQEINKAPKIRKSKEITDNLIKNAKTNTAYIIGFTILLIAVLAFFNEFNVESMSNIKKLSITVFFIAFCSYAMHINFTEKGIVDGKLHIDYTTAKTNYDTESNTFIEKGYKSELSEFCSSWVEEELESARKNILQEISLPYEIYIEKYVRLDDKSIKQLNLSDKCKDIIIKANSLKPLQLNPDDIIQTSASIKNRKNPIGKNPQYVKIWKQAFKLFTTFLTAIGTSLIVLDTILNASFANVAECLVKLLTIIWNGYRGYRKGYNLIVIDTVNWLNEKTKMVKEATMWAEKKTKIVEESSNEEKPSQDLTLQTV